jgi:hypothetical protein
MMGSNQIFHYRKCFEIVRRLNPNETPSATDVVTDDGVKRLFGSARTIAFMNESGSHIGLARAKTAYELPSFIPQSILGVLGGSPICIKRNNVATYERNAVNIQLSAFLATFQFDIGCRVTFLVTEAEEYSSGALWLGFHSSLNEVPLSSSDSSSSL